MEGQTCNISLQIGGMTCSACCAAIESALDTLPGVTNAVLSLIQQQARIEYHPNLITPVSTLPGHLHAMRASSTDGHHHSCLSGSVACGNTPSECVDISSNVLTGAAAQDC